MTMRTSPLLPSLLQASLLGLGTTLLCASAAAATLNGTTTLEASSPQFARPFANCSANTVAFKFTAVDFEVDAAGAYSISAPATAQVTDPWLQLYRSPFTASLPQVNCIIGDDDSGGSFGALIANQPLTAGTIYTAIITTFDPAQVGTVNWSITGGGNFVRRNGFVSIHGTPNAAAGSIALDLRLSSNGVDTTDTLYWIAVAPGAAAPSFTQVLTGNDGSGAAAAFSGSFANTALNASTTATISGLAAGAAYDLYVTLGNGSNPGTASFTNGTVRALDFTPNVPVFAPITNAALNTGITSAQVTLTGFTDAVPISITGGEYSIDSESGPFTSTAGTVQPGQKVNIRQTSSTATGTTTTATLSVGAVSANFAVTTLAPALPVVPNAIPTLGEWGLALMALLVAAFGLRATRRLH